MRASYLKKAPVNAVDASISYSNTWKMIVQHREVAMKRMIKKIGNGSDTYLWYDNWLDNNSLLAMPGLQSPLITQKSGEF